MSYAINVLCNFGLLVYLVSILLHFHKIIFRIHHICRVFQQCGAVCEPLPCLSLSFLHQTVDTILVLPACFQYSYNNRLTIFTKSFSTYITNVGCELPFFVSLSVFTSNCKYNFGLACLLSILLYNRLTTFTKSFSAYITNVGSFTSVEPGVYYHFVSLREGLMTKLTRVGSGICEY